MSVWRRESQQGANEGALITDRNVVAHVKRTTAQSADTAAKMNLRDEPVPSSSMYLCSVL